MKHDLLLMFSHKEKATFAEIKTKMSHRNSLNTSHYHHYHYHYYVCFIMKSNVINGRPYDMKAGTQDWDQVNQSSNVSFAASESQPL